MGYANPRIAAAHGEVISLKQERAMKRIWRWTFNILTVVSVLIFVSACAIQYQMFPDMDFSVYWSFHGRLICLDTFDDASYLTIRRFSPWPSSVPLQSRITCVETGTEIPSPWYPTWVDTSGQPVSHRDSAPGNHEAGPVAVEALGRIPLTGSLYGSTILPTIWLSLWTIRHIRRWMDRRRTRTQSASYFPVIYGPKGKQ